MHNSEAQASAKEQARFLDQWIRIHWFELITLVLLCFNIWFVLELLRVLTAVNEVLILIANRLERTRSDGVVRRPTTGTENRLSPRRSVVVIAGLLVLSWMVLIAIITVCIIAKASRPP